MPRDRTGVGGRTVREGARTTREPAATVRDSGATARDDGATVREGDRTLPDAVPAAEAQEPPVAGWLPPSLAADYRMVESLPARGGEADLYVVEPRDPADPVRRVAKVYRQGIDPKEDVLQRVRSADPGHVVRVEAYGQDAGRWWELMEYVEQGSLRMLMEREGPQVAGAVVMDILRQLNEALAGLHRLDMEHRDLKPGNVLVRSRDPLELVLTDFGISSVMEATVHFTDTARTIRYAPPEAIGSVVSDAASRRSMVVIEHTTWDYWSLGIMLVEMLTGTHPYAGLSEAVIAHQLATQNIEELVEGVSDPDWRRLCRGLLRRAPSMRWDAEAVSRWLADPVDSGLRVAEEAPPAGRPGATIDFDGAAYATPADLGRALSRDWDKAESFWKRRFQDVRTWLADGLGLQALGDALDTVDDDELSLDAQVFSFIYLLAPDAPLRFRGEEVSVERLAALGESAVYEADDDAVETLLRLHREGVVTLAGSLPGQEALADVSRRWNDAVQEYARLRMDLAALGVWVPEPDDEQLVMLLASSLPGSPLVDALRDHAWRACTEDAWRCQWFRELGAPDEMSIPAMVMVPYLHLPAAQRGRFARKRALRGCIGGIVSGAVFGMLVGWADVEKPGGGIYNPPGFQDDGVWGGVFLVALLIFVLRASVAWVSGSYGKRWRRILDRVKAGAGSAEERAPHLSWRSLLLDENRTRR